MIRFLTILLILPIYCFSQNQSEWWHGIERSVHYKPVGEDFVKVDGKLRFNRALYGGNTAFRIEAGDLPEFALYLPGMGGNFKLGLINEDRSRWLIDANHIETRYRPGSMHYQIEDNIIENAKLSVSVISCFDKEAMIVKITAGKIPGTIQLVVAFGGATGLKFSRDGDIGADPESSFYLNPAYCKDNTYRIEKNQFELLFGSKKPLTEEERYEIQNFPGYKSNVASRSDLKSISGIFPASSMLKIADANSLQTPIDFIQSHGKDQPALAGILQIHSDSTYYFLVQNKAVKTNNGSLDLADEWKKAESSRKQLAARINIDTPDEYINTLGGVLGIAADAIWEDPSYLHGAVAWRMRLNGWRGAYAADVLGWHDRARKHFSSYALSQLTNPEGGPVVMDTALHLARSLEKLGTSVFSSGYISRNPNGDFRAHHYDMNLVFVDQLLTHFQWTGDTEFLRESWPLLERHMKWEKRNFDSDGDGLYDSYAAIWASDALQYSGGGVTHSSAYNYRSNIIMAKLAGILNEDPSAYTNEANKIHSAVNRELWLDDKGWYAEYKDLLGNKLVHPSAGLWTVYHAIDSKLPDPFQSYRLLQYVKNQIPHIPIRAKGLPDSTLYSLSTSDWQPYTWSLNNVALAELMHTSLAFWQGGDSEEAFKLWKSSLIESMYIGASPGNIQQLSFYDAIRGELYRDFADPIGMTARSLVEGLFGIQPDALKDTLYVKPGFPAAWDHASIQTPDIVLKWNRKTNTDQYTINCRFPSSMNLKLQVRARAVSAKEIIVNGKKLTGYYDSTAIGHPVLCLDLPHYENYSILITWNNEKPETFKVKDFYLEGDSITVSVKEANIISVYEDGQVRSFTNGTKRFISAINKPEGVHNLLVRLKQGKASWWVPLNIYVKSSVQISHLNGKVAIKNLSAKVLSGELWFNNKPLPTIDLKPYEEKEINISEENWVSGTNLVVVKQGNKSYRKELMNWKAKSNLKSRYDKIDISGLFNDSVNNIFRQEYLSPRPKVSVLQLPVQGIGNWAYPLVNPVINDSALRQKAGVANEIRLSGEIPFSTPGNNGTRNVVFTSMWDNYPDSVLIPLNGRSSHIYFLMTGSTNPMQSRITNGEIQVEYKDGTIELLPLKNPENWWPIEQDYYIDGYAFKTGAVKPPRIYFKDATEQMDAKDYISIRGFSNFAVSKGAATVLDLPLNPQKELRQLKLKAVANDVVIGLMSVTLVRDLN